MSREPKKLDLTTEESDLVDRVVKSLSAVGHEQRTFRLALNQWADFVSNVENGYDFSIYDYKNDLSIRDVIAKAVEMTPDALSPRLLQAIGPWDDRFFEATKGVEVPIGSQKIADGAHWWWRRIPRILKSELRHDLESEGSGITG